MSGYLSFYRGMSLALHKHSSCNSTTKLFVLQDKDTPFGNCAMITFPFRVSRNFFSAAIQINPQNLRNTLMHLVGVFVT